MLHAKSALVTGGTRGIGRAIAERLLALGANVGITALPEHSDDAHRSIAALDPSGSRGRAYDLDVRSHDSIADAFDAFSADFGQIDILVNNAAVRLVSSSLDTDEACWDEVMDVNVKGVFLCSQMAARQMRSGGGSIVNLTSQLGLVAARDRAAYCASKAAVIHLTRALALDWAPYEIRVNAVAPGPTQTPATPLAANDDAAIELLTRMPLGRPIQPDEVANAVAYLAGPLATAVSGHTLLVDGGWTLE